MPAALESITDGTEFVNRLPEFDAEFDKLREEAAKEGAVLRFVGVVDVEKNLVSADLVKCVFLVYASSRGAHDVVRHRYPTTHPFATSLGGSDNIIMFHSERYSPRPLIVQGAGAGAAVTAMGVMSDLLKLVL